MSRHLTPHGAVTTEFAELMVKLAAAFGTVLTEARIRIYAVALGDLPFELVRAAAGRAVREVKFFPSVGELREYAMPGAADAALVAWTRLNAGVSEIGAYASVVIEDPQAAVALVDVFGSWPKFCAVEEGPALARLRQEFLVAYRVARGRSMDGPIRLPGLCESQGGPKPMPGAVWQGRIGASGIIAERLQLEEPDGHERQAPALPQGSRPAAGGEGEGEA